MAMLTVVVQSQRFNWLAVENWLVLAWYRSIWYRSMDIKALVSKQMYDSQRCYSKTLLA